jgi:quercetin dioxygenase-like cupin family protein
MTKRCATLFAVCVVLSFGIAIAQEHEMTPDMDMAQPIVVTADSVTWMDGPPVLPPGAKMAVLEGNPGGMGTTYTIRFKVPAGYVVPPHWHPVAENVTVLSGSIVIGMGDDVDRESAQTLGVGEFFSMPAEHHHWALFDEASTIQLHGVGPFGITYVHPEDDPQAGMGEATP